MCRLLHYDAAELHAVGIECLVELIIEVALGVADRDRADTDLIVQRLGVECPLVSGGVYKFLDVTAVGHLDLHSVALAVFIVAVHLSETGLVDVTGDFGHVDRRIEVVVVLHVRVDPVTCLHGDQDTLGRAVAPFFYIVDGLLLPAGGQGCHDDG